MIRNMTWNAVMMLIVTFMLFPFAVLLLFCFSQSEIIAFPITGWSLRWFSHLFAQNQFWTALQNSAIVTGTVGVVSTLFGTMAALGFARMPPKIAGFSMATITLPLMLPPLVLGVAALTYFTQIGIRPGLHTVIMAHLVFTQPFVILIIYARLSKFDYAVINSARDLGASSWAAFRTVLLPIVRPTIVGAALVAMALSIDDFVVTFFTIGGGNTMPTFLWGMLRKGVNPSINIVGVILMTVTLLASFAAFRITRYRA